MRRSRADQGRPLSRREFVWDHKVSGVYTTTCQQAFSERCRVDRAAAVHRPGLAIGHRGGTTVQNPSAADATDSDFMVTGWYAIGQFALEVRQCLLKYRRAFVP